ncbi:lysine-specific permease [Tsukamurella pulmonis]|uniref:amino acid permease n=1 Tax=Tsukamurella pulmonis TaxID=47312 RepID=UPI00079BDA80|nr:amino acid permease [Tsukamurella pulmonis]KXP13113.1 gamma-aminobutyrate permease [Tsukamurella pulmonis]RDH10554.1 amino acid permease [Tsukamurella pulmonis]BDD81371.1 lysine-specific permease [Tsukamurella pulmonis]
MSSPLGITPDPALRKGLQSRHISMIALGGAIGTGLFVASGATIHDAGPGGALVAYAVMGIMVFFLMQSLGEMSAYMPCSNPFEEYGSRFVSKSFGFAAGWNYWFNWSITLAAEVVAAGLIMKFWLPDVPSWVWSLIFLGGLLALNLFAVKAFGEAEFWFASIKVIAVVVFLIVGVLMVFGVIGGPSPGFENWTIGDAPFVDWPLGMLSVFLIAGFAFQGTEMVAVAAGEAIEPRSAIPRAVRTVFFRILLFYIGTLTIIAFLIPYTSPELLDASDENVAVAPFTLVFKLAGIDAAASIMNAVILVAILSAGNASLYAATRALYGLGVEGNAPRIFGKVSRTGVPAAAVAATAAIGALCFVASRVGDGKAYTVLVTASSVAGFVTWVGIAWAHYRFRRAWNLQGRDLKELPYKAWLYPAGPIVALLMCVAVIAGQYYLAVEGGEDGGLGLWLTSYAALILFVGLWWGHKLVTKTPTVDLRTADLSPMAAASAHRDPDPVG